MPMPRSWPSYKVCIAIFVVLANYFQQIGKQSNVLCSVIKPHSIYVSLQWTAFRIWIKYDQTDAVIKKITQSHYIDIAHISSAVSISHEQENYNSSKIYGHRGLFKPVHCDQWF